jgi:maltooligosyltrehalose trehalohydrolase
MTTTEGTKKGRVRRRFPVGSEIVGKEGVSFRVWSDTRRSIDVVLEGGPGVGAAQVSFAMTREEDGYFSAIVPLAGAGTLYRFRLDKGDNLYPDPASRYQPQGPHGSSMVIDPLTYKWNDDGWKGVAIEGQTIYEMHIGTYTHEGTWQAASRELEELARLGITIIEQMPVADFPGRFGWGYDGVDLFAPTRLYGTPDDFRSFVNRAHSVGLGVILDVVYNHLGPDGNYLSAFTDSFFTDRYQTEWGRAINYDGSESAAVRDFFIANARYWIDEFHLDGLRLDATQSMFDSSPVHILSELSSAVHEAGRRRQTIILAENEPQDSKLAMPSSQGGFGIDGLWNDDFHHSAMVALTGRREAYYTDYLGKPQEFLSMIKWGYLYQGQYYSWQSKCRGTPSRQLGPAAFVLFLQNHDQIANSCCGRRLQELTSPSLLRAMTALLLLSPGTPMLFQGEEFGASSPFLYFVDLPEPLSQKVREGRLEFLAQFPSLAHAEWLTGAADPTDQGAFSRSKLDLSERTTHRYVYTFYRDLLRLRRHDPIFRLQKKGAVDGAVFAQNALALRFFGGNSDDRLILVNLDVDLKLEPAPEPLLAPPLGKEWRMLWNSEDPQYGGTGFPPEENAGPKRIPGRTTVVFSAVPDEEEAT